MDEQLKTEETAVEETQKSTVSTEEKACADSSQAVGECLQQVRQQKNLSVHNIAQRLNLERKVIEALEQNIPQDLPPIIFVQGYVRCYAKLLQLDADTLVLRYLDQQKNADSPELQFNQIEKKSSSRDAWFRFMTIGIIITLIVLVVMWRQAMETAIPEDMPLVNTEIEADNIDIVIEESEKMGFWQNIATFVGINSDDNDNTTDDNEAENNDKDEASITLDNNGTDMVAANNETPTEKKSFYIQHTKPIIANDVVEKPAIVMLNDTEAVATLTPINDEVKKSDETETVSATTETSENTTDTQAEVEIIEEKEVKPVLPVPVSDLLTIEIPEKKKDETIIISDNSEIESETPETVKKSVLGLEAGFVRLSLSATGSSWMEIKDANRKRLYMGTAKSGDSFNIEGKAPLHVVIGRATVINAKSNGKPLDFSDFIAKKRVARFSLTENGMEE